jgi:hypothetical protein
MSIFEGGFKIIDYKDEELIKEKIKKQPVDNCMKICNDLHSLRGVSVFPL